MHDSAFHIPCSSFASARILTLPQTVGDTIHRENQGIRFFYLPTTFITSIPSRFSFCSLPRMQDSRVANDVVGLRTIEMGITGS